MNASPEPRLGPEVDASGAAFIHPSAWVHGSVRFLAGSSMWTNAVIRAECNAVVVGVNANVQDFAMIHVGYENETLIGAFSSIAHHATVHGATVGENCLIGINATLMDGCVVGDNSIVGSGAVVTEGMDIPPNSVVVGAPAKVIKTRNNWRENRLNALLYCRNAAHYARGDHRAWHGPDYEVYLATEKQRLADEFARLFPAG